MHLDMEVRCNHLIYVYRCQSICLEEVKLEENIAKNKALKENVFMMLICIELRIPLFLVGKPGSSKSLAKTIVADVMQGNSSYSELFRKFKQVCLKVFQIFGSTYSLVYVYL